MTEILRTHCWRCGWFFVQGDLLSCSSVKFCGQNLIICKNCYYSMNGWDWNDYRLKMEKAFDEQNQD